MTTKGRVIVFYTVMLPVVFGLTMVVALQEASMNAALVISGAYTALFGFYFTYLNWGSVKQIVKDWF